MSLNSYDLLIVKHFLLIYRTYIMAYSHPIDTPKPNYSLALFSICC